MNTREKEIDLNILQLEAELKELKKTKKLFNIPADSPLDFLKKFIQRILDIKNSIPYGVYVQFFDKDCEWMFLVQDKKFYYSYRIKDLVNKLYVLEENKLDLLMKEATSYFGWNCDEFICCTMGLDKYVFDEINKRAFIMNHKTNLLKRIKRTLKL